MNNVSFGTGQARAMLLVAAAIASAATARFALGGQIYVASYNTNFQGQVGEYDSTTGTAINASLVSGLNEPFGVAVAGGKLYVASFAQNQAGAGTIGVYDATTGTPINASLVTGLNGPGNIAVSGGHLFVGSFGDSTVSEYDATTGAGQATPLLSGVSGGHFALSGSNIFASTSASTVGEYTTSGAAVNASLISGLSVGPDDIAVSGSHVFLSFITGTVGEYDANSGAAINASFLSGLNRNRGIAVVGSNLLVANTANGLVGGGTIGEYDAGTGTPVNSALISGFTNPDRIAATPEPSCLAFAAFVLCGLEMRRRRRSSSAVMPTADF
jgi:MYXO-CTERM domain-containing protein